MKALNLFACRNFNNAGLRHIADGCDNLELLNIDEVNYLSDEAMLYFIGRRKGKLKHLILDGESLTDKSFVALGELSRLELLSISFADNMQSQGLAAIAKLQHLEYLKVRRGREILANDFWSAFGGGNLKNLLYLNLAECSNLADLGLMAIAKNCPNLGTLDLSWCWELTDNSLLMVVLSCKYLINLHLCGVVRLLGSFLSHIPRRLIGLQLLDLEQCPDIELALLQEWKLSL